MKTNKSPKEIVRFAEAWLVDNVDKLPLEILKRKSKTGG
jgi:hypothetical protein